MDNVICLNKNYSTTKLVTKEKPIMAKKSEYKLKPKLFLPFNVERKGEGGLRTKGLFKRSYKNKPLISIVTVVYNGEKYLEQTIKSVLDQDYDNVEYIIIDGGSIDGTVDIIKRYEEKIDYWVSEPDTGIYNAMNKGAGLCSGDYVAFLNADDWYNIDTLEIVAVASNSGNMDYIYGDVDIYDGANFHRTFVERREEYKVKIPFGHPSLFVQTQYMLQDPFNLKYKVVADYNFILGLIAKKLSHTYINQSIVNFRTGGISSASNYDREKLFLYCSHFGMIRGIYSYLSITKNPVLVRAMNLLRKLVGFFKVRFYGK